MICLRVAVKVMFCPNIIRSLQHLVKAQSNDSFVLEIGVGKKTANNVQGFKAIKGILRTRHWLDYFLSYVLFSYVQ